MYTNKHSCMNKAYDDIYIYIYIYIYIFIYIYIYYMVLARYKETEREDHGACRSNKASNDTTNNRSSKSTVVTMEEINEGSRRPMAGIRQASIGEPYKQQQKGPP